MRLWSSYVTALSVRYVHVWSGLVSAPRPMGTQNVNKLHGLVNYDFGCFMVLALGGSVRLRCGSPGLCQCLAHSPGAPRPRTYGFVRVCVLLLGASVLCIGTVFVLWAEIVVRSPNGRVGH